MTSSLRLNEDERKIIRRKSREINKQLVQAGYDPLKESEIIHKILEITIAKAEVNEKGEIEINLNLGQESTTK